MLLLEGGGVVWYDIVLKRACTGRVQALVHQGGRVRFLSTNSGAYFTVAFCCHLLSPFLL